MTLWHNTLQRVYIIKLDTEHADAQVLHLFGKPKWFCWVYVVTISIIWFVDTWYTRKGERKDDRNSRERHLFGECMHALCVQVCQCIHLKIFKPRHSRFPTRSIWFAFCISYATEKSIRLLADVWFCSQRLLPSALCASMWDSQMCGRTNRRCCLLPDAMITVTWATQN